MIFSKRSKWISTGVDGERTEMACVPSDCLLLSGTFGMVVSVVLFHRVGLLVSVMFYPLLCMSLVLALSVSVSIWNRQASLDLTYTVFTLVWMPVSVLLSSPSVPSDVGLVSTYYSSSTFTTPTWIRQCAFHYMLDRYVTQETINLKCLVWVLTIRIAVDLSSKLFIIDNRNAHHTSVGTTLDGPPFHNCLIITETAIVLLLASYTLIGSSVFNLLISLCFCIMTSPSAKGVVVNLVTFTSFGIFDGLEKEYTDGFISILDLSIHFILLVLGVVNFDMYTILLASVSIYNPVYDVITFGWGRIQSERSVLHFFPRAGFKDLLGHDDVCAVCLCGMLSARVTPCGHYFHGKCLRMCLKEKAVCPLCIRAIFIPSTTD